MHFSNQKVSVEITLAGWETTVGSISNSVYIFDWTSLGIAGSPLFSEACKIHVTAKPMNN